MQISLNPAKRVSQAKAANVEGEGVQSKQGSGVFVDIVLLASAIRVSRMGPTTATHLTYTLCVHASLRSTEYRRRT
jgi:hypothetical protein